MNVKRIKRELMKKHRELVASIDDEIIARIVSQHTFITGGAIVSLLQDEEPKDYDIYFANKEACMIVAQYYINKMNQENQNGNPARVNLSDDGRIEIFVHGSGVIKTTYEEGYKPVFASTNAITLSDSVQLIIRFYGDPDEIHTNYDFIHCTGYFVPSTNTLTLSQQMLEAVVTKELKYTGSKYPVASVIRTKKFIKRGWNINAGQYLKMILQCHELDLKNPKVLMDQLTGVDMHYFAIIIDEIESILKNNPNTEISIEYVCELIDRVFDEEELEERD